jgi:hypothetical protein
LCGVAQGLAPNARACTEKYLSVGKAEKSKKNGLFLQRGGLFEFPVSPKWMYNRKESL